jgi:zinc carboxypeptidase
MKKILITLVVLFLTGNLSINAQSIKSPAEFLGYELGSRFTRHHKIVEYFNYVSNSTAKVVLQKYGETNEYRPLYVTFISSEENITNLEKIREDNLKRTGLLEGSATSEISIVWLSYNVHGNEASSSEAAMKTLYDLITKKQDWLKTTVVIIDPCVNPDGRDRYVNWYNENKNTPYNINYDVTEHNEPWPRGRANHYLFDLNRDWAWITQVESQHRLKVYNKWLPQIHVDFHEQGINEPYYFAPAAEPYHEVISNWQRHFQVELGKNHAKYFDKENWLYFTKERFDLFYPSYGDTYPTYSGAIGMTYEQAGNGSAGLGVLNQEGTILTLVDRVKHQTTTGLSTVELASKNASKLVNEFEKFFNNSNEKRKSYILKGSEDKIAKVEALLDKHEIIHFRAESKTIKAYDYNNQKTTSIKTSINDLVVPTNQPKGKMVKVLLEPEAKLSDSITYDITAWSIPFAYGLNGFYSESVILNSKTTTPVNFNNKTTNNAYAYLSKWNEISDATFLGDLLEEGFNVRFSHKNLTIEGSNFKRGSLIVLRGENKHILNFDEIIVEIANRLHKKLTPVQTGFADAGPDFGSPRISMIKHKNIAVLSGDGTSSLSFGEIWHFFETQLKYPINVINTKNFKRIDWGKYDILILPNGYVAGEDELKILADYTSKGGNIIAIGSSLNSFAGKEGFQLKKKEAEKSTNNLAPYNQRVRNYMKNTITGSIFNSTIDNTHPLAYGYPNNYYSLKLSSSSFEYLEEGINVGYFPKNTTNISGFAGANALKLVPNSLLFGIENKGKGKLIYMVDNPLFRSFWENGKLFFANAVFLN